MKKILGLVMQPAVLQVPALLLCTFNAASCQCATYDHTMNSAKMFITTSDCFLQQPAKKQGQIKSTVIPTRCRNFLPGPCTLRTDSELCPAAGSITAQKHSR
jgi:hypothetical protein